MIQIRKQRVTALCLGGAQRVEDNKYDLGCKSEGVVREWDEASLRVQTWLVSHDSCQELCRLVLRALGN